MGISLLNPSLLALESLRSFPRNLFVWQVFISYFNWKWKIIMKKKKKNRMIFDVRIPICEAYASRLLSLIVKQCGYIQCKQDERERKTNNNFPFCFAVVFVRERTLPVKDSDSRFQMGICSIRHIEMRWLSNVSTENWKWNRKKKNNNDTTKSKRNKNRLSNQSINEI